MTSQSSSFPSALRYSRTLRMHSRISSVVCRSESQPSFRAARRSAKSEMPPTQIGIGALGIGGVSFNRSNW